MSKYADLPDIDTAPDVYETEDVAPVASRRGELDDSDDELLGASSSAARRAGTSTVVNEAIDESGLPSFDAAGKRFGALAALTYTLYPTMTPRSDPTLPSASLPSDDGAHASPTVEHPRARLRRLRYEMEELEQFLAQAPESTEPEAHTPSEKEVEEARKTARMMEELKGLQQGLRGLDVKVARPMDEAHEGWELSLKKLEDSMTHLAALSPPTGSSLSPTVEGKRQPRAAQDASSKVADLDQRLAVLESVLGTQFAESDDGRAEMTPILPTLSKLDHLLTLLTQPRHLDAISRRIKLLLTDLDRAQNSSKSSGNKRQSLSGTDGGAGLGLLSPSLAGGGMPISAAGSPSSAATLTPAQSQKLEQAFQLVPRLQPLLPLLPHLLARLRSLSDLHESAANIDGTLKGLEQSNARLASAQKEAETVISRLESSIKGNEEMIEGNFRALGARVGEIRRRLAALDGGESAAEES